MTLRVAVDFGTSSTCVAVSVGGREPQVVVVDGQPLVSSAVFAAADGELFVGQEAERQAAIDPARYEPHPKRRIDERELLLGSRVVAVLDVVGAVLARAVSEARRLADGAAVDLLVLTHPADWGAVRSRVLRQAGHDLAEEVVLVPEPVAAAVFHAASHSLDDGATLAVLDLGGGTVDVSVVRRQSANSRAARATPAAAGRADDRAGGFGVLATKGDPNFGGADIDQLLLSHIGSLVTGADPEAWRRLVEGRELPDRRRRRVLAEDVRGAKETLSRHTYTDVPLPPPFPDAHITRADLERLIVSPLGRAVNLTVAAISEAGLRPDELGAVFLVGGSSRIPMVARLVHERIGIVPTTLDQPETVVARGALRAVSKDPNQTGDLPTVHISPPPVRSPSARRQPPGAVPAAFVGRDLRPLNRPRAPIGMSPVTPGPQSAGRPFPAAAFPTHPSGPSRSPGDGTAVSATSEGATRRRLVVAGFGVLVLALVTALILVLLNRGDAEAGKKISRYGFQFALPEQWQQTGDKPSTHQVLIKPSNAQDGDDLIAVQRFELTENTDFRRDAIVAQLRDRVREAGATDFASSRSFGDRNVAYYRRTTSPGVSIDWYVIFKGTIQVSTGCQHTRAGESRVRSACEDVVRSLAITGQGK